ncbi:MAG: PDZ domain-containing protein [Myxococcales bacterium]|nr:PDZ domain-containing protein [Myxococcales bacterium]
MELADLTGEVRAWIDRLGLSMQDAARHAAVDVEKLERILSTPELGVTTRELLQVIDGLGLGLADVRPLTPAKVIHHLDRARAAKSMTQKEVARVSGINRTHLVALFKQPNPNPKAETVVRLAAAIGCPLTIVQLRELQPLPAIAFVEAPVAAAANAPPPLASVANAASRSSAAAAMHAAAPTPRATSASATVTTMNATTPSSGAASASTTTTQSPRAAATVSATSGGAAAMHMTAPHAPPPMTARSPTTGAVNGAATATVTAASPPFSAPHRAPSHTPRVMTSATPAQSQPVAFAVRSAHKDAPAQATLEDLAPLVRDVGQKLSEFRATLDAFERERHQDLQRIEDDARARDEERAREKLARDQEHSDELARAQEHAAEVEQENEELTEKIETDARTHRQELARVEERAAAKEVAAAAKVRNTGLVAGGAATLGAIGTAVVLDRVAPENRPTAQALLGGAGTLLVAGGVASESDSVVRWGALAAGVGILGSLIYDAFRVRDRDAARGGVGVEVNFIDSALDITAITPDSPAARAGLQIGDKIVAINDRGVLASGAEKAAERLVGPIGETVALKVIRISPWSLLDVKLTREAKA